MLLLLLLIAIQAFVDFFVPAVQFGPLTVARRDPEGNPQPDCAAAEAAMVAVVDSIEGVLTIGSNISRLSALCRVDQRLSLTRFGFWVICFPIFGAIVIILDNLKRIRVSRRVILYGEKLTLPDASMCETGMVPRCAKRTPL